MLELKAFVQESVHALDNTQLQLLSETLRVDLRGCDDRKDIEQILTGLLCLDKDTALGTFLTWLRASERHAQQAGAVLLAKKSTFATTFVPVISPRRALSNNNEELHVKDHHLTDEIKVRLEELKLLETDFKDAERHVHNGTPTFEKLKSFLVKLTKLRAKEEDVRRFFITQSKLLTEQHTQMKNETLHTRAQLDFFVDGFTNLRRRHDALLDKSTAMKAENEVAQDVFLSITAHETHLSEILHRTLLHQLTEKQALQDKLDSASKTIEQLTHKQNQLEQLISRLKQQRGDALKDASSYKQQLRKTKQKMDNMAVDGPDCAFFRQQAIQLRGSLTTLLGLFRESITRDTKSPKQSVSKEILRAVHSVLLAAPSSKQNLSVSSKQIRVAGASAMDTSAVGSSVARVVEKKEAAAQDIDQAVRGVVLLGGNQGEAATCAALLSAKLKYAPVDLTQLLTRLREDAVAESQRRAAQSLVVMAESLETGAAEQSAPAVPSSPMPVTQPPPPPASIENYLAPLKTALVKIQRELGARGFLFFNCELSAREANLLIGCGVPIDSVIELKTPPPPPPPQSPSKATDTGTAASPSKPGTQAKTTPATTGTRAPASPSRATASGSKPAAKATTPSTSPTKPPSRSDPKRNIATPPGTTPTTATRPAASTATSPTKQPSQPKIDRRAVFAGMPQAFAQLEPVLFVEDRVDQIVDVLTKLKQRKATPFVVWDETTSQVNESLLMYGEDLHMMLWVEQENRKPKKPGQDTPAKPGTPASSSSSGSRSSGGATTSPSKPSTAKTPSKPVAAKGRATSPSRGTPAKTPVRAASPTKAKTPLTGAASPKKPAAASPPKSPAKRKA